MANSKSWVKIARDYKILEHDFSRSSFVLSAAQIKTSVQRFKKTTEKEVRILCKQDTRESRPKVFKERGLFLLPVKNGVYNIIKGEGYMDIPEIRSKTIVYSSKLGFHPESSEVGDSEMQHLDYAYASSLIRTFMKDDSLVLTIRGRKRTPEFDFKVSGKVIHVSSVQTEVDAGYEGKNQIVLIEAKRTGTTNTIIRQLYYPFRQWSTFTKKKVAILFFEKDHKNKIFSIWQFKFKNEKNYNSIKLVKSARYSIN